MSKEKAEIFRFKAGEVVPEWIVSQEPYGPYAGAGPVTPLRFVMDALVVDAPTVILVCPIGGESLGYYRSVIGMFGLDSIGVRLVGTAKLVMTSHHWISVFPFDQPPAKVSMEDAIRFQRGEITRLGPDLRIPEPDTEPAADRAPATQKAQTFNPFPSKRSWRERLTAAWLALFA